MGLQYVLSIFGRTLSDRPLSSAGRMTLVLFRRRALVGSKVLLFQFSFANGERSLGQGRLARSTFSWLLVGHVSKYRESKSSVRSEWVFLFHSPTGCFSSLTRE
jgi:hypothetical protein